jgi:hypothetical protein
MPPSSEPQGQQRRLSLATAGAERPIVWQAERLLKPGALAGGKSRRAIASPPPSHAPTNRNDKELWIKRTASQPHGDSATNPPNGSIAASPCAGLD